MSDDEAERDAIDEFFDRQHIGRPRGHSRIPLSHDERRVLARESRNKNEERRKKEREERDEQMSNMMMSMISGLQRMEHAIINSNRTFVKALEILYEKIG
jgi:hypothetical protein